MDIDVKNNYNLSINIRYNDLKKWINKMNPHLVTFKKVNKKGLIG